MQQNLGYVAEELERILLQHIYPLLNSARFPLRVWASSTVEKVLFYNSMTLSHLANLFSTQERQQFMGKWSKRTDLSSLLGPDARQKTLDFSEQIFSVYPPL